MLGHVVLQLEESRSTTLKCISGYAARGRRETRSVAPPPAWVKGGRIEVTSCVLGSFLRRSYPRSLFRCLTAAIMGRMHAPGWARVSEGVASLGPRDGGERRACGQRVEGDDVLGYCGIDHHQSHCETFSPQEGPVPVGSALPPQRPHCK